MATIFPPQVRDRDQHNRRIVEIRGGVLTDQWVTVFEGDRHDATRLLVTFYGVGYDDVGDRTCDGCCGVFAPNELVEDDDLRRWCPNCR